MLATSTSPTTRTSTAATSTDQGALPLAAALDKNATLTSLHPLSNHNAQRASLNARASTREP